MKKNLNFFIEYNNIQLFFENKNKKILEIASLKSFLLYDYQNNKNFKEIFHWKKINKIIELSNNMIAVNKEKNNIFFINMINYIIIIYIMNHQCKNKWKSK